MPVPYNSKSRQNSPPSTVAPARNGHKRTPSSNPGYSPTITSGAHQQKLNVVTRVAVEGKARRGHDGASIRMFLKVCISYQHLQLLFILIIFVTDNFALGFRHARLDYPSLLRFEVLFSLLFIYSHLLPCRGKCQGPHIPGSPIRPQFCTFQLLFSCLALASQCCPGPEFACSIF